MAVDHPHGGGEYEKREEKTPYQIEADRIIGETALGNGDIQRKIDDIFDNAKKQLDDVLEPIIEGYQVKLYWKQAMDIKFVMAVVNYAKQNAYGSFQGGVFSGLEDEDIVVTPANWQTEGRRLLGMMVLRIIEVLSTFSDEDRIKYVDTYSNIFQEFDSACREILGFSLTNYTYETQYQAGTSTVKSIDIDVSTLKVTQVTRTVTEHTSRYTKIKDGAVPRRGGRSVKL